MSLDRNTHLTLLERLDVALAMRLAGGRHQVDLADPESWTSDVLREDEHRDPVWITRVLALRGFEVSPERVRDVRRERARKKTDVRSDQETRLILGLSAVLDSIRSIAARGRMIDGWCATELFRRLIADIPRFRGHALRRDAPWDAVSSLEYPDPDELPGLLERFCFPQHYGDTADFERLHPVRQAERLMWHFGRIAPFPDFNLLMGFILMNTYLLGRGYPMVMPRAEDGGLLAQLVAGPKPHRVIQFESRLVDQLGG
jgi:hypothetical protein